MAAGTLATGGAPSMCCGCAIGAYCATIQSCNGSIQAVSFLLQLGDDNSYFHLYILLRAVVGAC